MRGILSSSGALLLIKIEKRVPKLRDFLLVNFLSIYDKRVTTHLTKRICILLPVHCLILRFFF